MKATIKTLIAGLLMALLLSACGGSAEKKVSYSLKTNLQDGKMVLVGVGGNINGVVSPTLSANVGDTVEITFINGDGIEHDLAFPDFNAHSGHVMGQDSRTTLRFVADKSGTFTYSCTIPGHIEAGMYGTFEVTGEPAP
jgi:nitrite reductase (NO-forming)